MHSAKTQEKDNSMKKFLLAIPVAAALLALTSLGAMADHTAAGRHHMAVGRRHMAMARHHRAMGHPMLARKHMKMARHHMAMGHAM